MHNGRLPYPTPKVHVYQSDKLTDSLDWLLDFNNKGKEFSLPSI